MPDAALKRRIPFYDLLINKKSYTTPNRLKCYAHTKKNYDKFKYIGASFNPSSTRISD